LIEINFDEYRAIYKAMHLTEKIRKLAETILM